MRVRELVCLPWRSGAPRLLRRDANFLVTWAGACHYQKVGNKPAWLALVVVALGCDGTAAIPPSATGAAGTTGTTGTAGTAGTTHADNQSAAWSWTACGAIPSTEVPLSTQYSYSPGDAVVGGYPRAAFPATPHITALAMSADGLTLVSMGGVTLVWDVAPVFSDSRASYVTTGAAERPRVEVSPDGRWLAIFGDGRVLVSRDGVPGPSFTFGVECWPAEARFSPDGQWLVGSHFGPGIDVYRVADFEGALGDGQLQPVRSLPASCGEPTSYGPPLGATARVAFTPDGRRLETETGAQFSTDDWQLVAEGGGAPSPHGFNGNFEVSADGASLTSDCPYDSDTGSLRCAPEAAPFPRFSPDGSWIVAGGTLRHVGSERTLVLDPTAVVGIFAPNGDVIAASADNSLTRYCRAD